MVAAARASNGEITISRGYFNVTVELREGNRRRQKEFVGYGEESCSKSPIAKAIFREVIRRLLAEGDIELISQDNKETVYALTAKAYGYE